MNQKKTYSALFAKWIVALVLCLSCRATTIEVRSGSAIFHFDAAALANLNYGSNPAIGALIFEEFFRGDDDRLRTRNQLLVDQIVPNFTAIPATNLKLEVNGSSVTNINPAGQPTRNRKPSTFSYDPANVTGTASGEIGFTGVTRFIGDFTGTFVLGDYVLRYNLPAGSTEPNRGWVFVNNYDFQGFPAFETTQVTVQATEGKLVIEGKLTIARELDLFFFVGDRGKIVGNFRFETPSAPASAPATPQITRLPSGFAQLTYYGKGNALYQIQQSSDLQQWTTLDYKVAGTGQFLTWIDPNSSTATRRFYRILEEN